VNKVNKTERIVLILGIIAILVSTLLINYKLNEKRELQKMKEFNKGADRMPGGEKPVYFSEIRINHSETASILTVVVQKGPVHEDLDLADLVIQLKTNLSTKVYNFSQSSTTIESNCNCFWISHIKMKQEGLPYTLSHGEIIEINLPLDYVNNGELVNLVAIYQDDYNQLTYITPHLENGVNFIERENNAE